MGIIKAAVNAVGKSSSLNGKICQIMNRSTRYTAGEKSLRL